MFTRIYNYINEEEYAIACGQLIWYQQKLAHVEGLNCSDAGKTERRKRLRLVIDCIKYSYNLWSDTLEGIRFGDFANSRLDQG